MGNKQPTSSSPPLSSQLYNIHPSLKSSKLVSTNFGPMLQYPFPISSTKTFNLEQYTAKQRQITLQWVSRYLLLPQKTHLQQNTCGTSQTLIFYFQLFPFRLDKQIQVRRNTRRKFEEEQLWYILYTGVSAIAEFEKRNEKLGKITSQNILLNSKGHIRFINKYSWPGADTTKDIFYTSPEEFSDRKIMGDKSSIFGLGLVIMECMLLGNVRELYGGGKGFNYQRFYEMIQEMNRDGRYSVYLKGVVRRMMELEMGERVAAGQLMKELKRYQEEILYFNKFT